jgi:hypothetical protein
MAKQISYTDSRGVSYDTSYWRLVYLSVDVEAKFAAFKFLGYRDVDARLTGKDPVGSYSFSISGVEFDIYYAKHLIEGKNIAEIAYIVAGDKLVRRELVTELVDGVEITEEKDVGFFHGGIDV